MVDADLPGFFHDAEKVAERGQRQTLSLGRLRLLSAIIAALGGALSWKAGKIDLWAIVSMAGFLAALYAEVRLWNLKPEEDWKAGRAVAEAVKSLAWRFAVAGNPFPHEIEKARRELGAQTAEVVRKYGQTLALDSANPSATPALTELRDQPFEKRRRAYIEYRVREQKIWYAGWGQWPLCNNATAPLIAEKKLAEVRMATDQTFLDNLNPNSLTVERIDRYDDHEKKFLPATSGATL